MHPPHLPPATAPSSWQTLCKQPLPAPLSSSSPKPWATVHQSPLLCILRTQGSRLHRHHIRHQECWKWHFQAYFTIWPLNLFTNYHHTPLLMYCTCSTTCIRYYVSCILYICIGSAYQANVQCMCIKHKAFCGFPLSRRHHQVQTTNHHISKKASACQC